MNTAGEVADSSSAIAPIAACARKPIAVDKCAQSSGSPELKPIAAALNTVGSSQKGPACVKSAHQKDGSDETQGGGG
jgi:hypothetical protein